MFKNLHKKPKIEILIFSILTLISFVCLCISILSFVYDVFPYGIHSESLGLTIITSLLSIELFILERPKVICLATTWFYVFITLMLRFYANVRLIITPIIFWGSISLLIVLGISIVFILRKNT